MNGYLEEFGLAKIYRDVRVCQIYEGTSGFQRMVSVIAGPSPQGLRGELAAEQPWCAVRSLRSKGDPASSAVAGREVAELLSPQQVPIAAGGHPPSIAHKPLDLRADRVATLAPVPVHRLSFKYLSVLHGRLGCAVGCLWCGAPCRGGLSAKGP